MSAPRGSVLVAAGILCSRLAGLVREAVLASFLGTSFAANAYRAAIRIPNLLQNLLGEGVLSASFIPVHARLLAEGREEDAGAVAGAVAGLLAVVAGVLALLGILLAGPITGVVAAGFSGPQRELTVTLVRILFPGTGFLVLSAWCLGVLNSHRRFFLSYVAPVLWNLAQIVVLIGAAWLVVADRTTTEGLASLATWLAVGTTIGGVLQFGVQVPTVRRLSRGLRVSLRTDLPGVRQTARAFVPVLAGRGVVQVSAFVDTLLASFLVTGAVAVLGYAQVLYVLPISLFGMSIAAAELPELSAVGPGDGAALRTRVRDGLRQIAFLVAPITVLYLVAGGAVVQMLFERGEFGPDDRLVVWIVLAGYAVGLLASTRSRLLQSVLYALDLPKFPARIAAVRVLVAVVLGLAMMFQLDQLAVVDGTVTLVGDLPATGPLPEEARNALDATLRLGALGLSLAAAAGAWLELQLLRRAVAVRIGAPRIGRARVRALTLASLAAGVVAWAVTVAVGTERGFLGALTVLLAAGLAYLGVTVVLRVPEVHHLVSALRPVEGPPPDEEV